MTIAIIPTGTEARVCEKIAQRQMLGIAKYRKTVADNPLTRRRWLRLGCRRCKSPTNLK